MNQKIRNVNLSDRFDLSVSPVLLNGTQALVRLMLMQNARDRTNDLKTAGFVTGYRGSPLGAVDFQMLRAQQQLQESNILFQPAFNEDLAATALWGTQQAELRGEGKYDGVFGLWYGKGPGVDRSGDVLRHANMAGTSPYGGVVLAMGDDHTGESSTTLHQSDPALIDAYIPVLSPAGVQEVIDYGIFGFALSRFSGNWVGLKCMKETIESTAVVDGSINRQHFKFPEIALPQGGLHIRLWDTPVEREARIIDYRRDAAEAFGHANKINKQIHNSKDATIGLVAAGKNWLDLIHALQLLGIDDDHLRQLGIATYKIGMIWPIDKKGFLEFAEGLDLIVIVEEKRKLIEMQVKDLLFNRAQRPRVIGNRNTSGEVLFSEKYELDPEYIARSLGTILIEEHRDPEFLHSRINRLSDPIRTRNSEDILERKPYFCSGCPHSTSTRIPEGSRAYSGIGCHYMVQWMDRDTLGFTHMGGEGANWIGEAPFSKRDHVFQNIGDGTYNHSGLLAIRASVKSGANITFKILFNDAVAMTGGQSNDGSLTPQQVVHELAAMGINKIACVFDKKEKDIAANIPKFVPCYERKDLDKVQRQFIEHIGVSAIVYLQTCAAEKRRRRKRGKFPSIDKRVFINTDICEGCGDCGIQSNCVSILPVQTEYGVKRAIDQSSCNMDLSCVNGFCPSFVTVEGSQPKKDKCIVSSMPDLPHPTLPDVNGTYSIVITGIGGTGVVTIGAILSMASYLDHLGIGMIEMAGLAQKGGAVTIHCRIAKNPEDISAIRVANGEADCVIGGDLVVTSSADILKLVNPEKTRSILNTQEIITGDFTRNADYEFPRDQLHQRLGTRINTERSKFINATYLAQELLGDSIYSNMLILGTAWQVGAIPICHDAIIRAIELNGANVEANITAFNYGRCVGADQDIDKVKINQYEIDNSSHKEDPVELRKQHLSDYQDEHIVQRYVEFVDRFTVSRLKQSVAESYHKLLAIKDEYEVARLHLETARKVSSEFEKGFKIHYHLSPSFFATNDDSGRPKKYQFGPWIRGIFHILAACRQIRGTWMDPFRFSQERRLQRKLIEQFEQDMMLVLGSGVSETSKAAEDLATLPNKIRGFGPVWLNNYESAMRERSIILKKLNVDMKKSVLNNQHVPVS